MEKLTAWVVLILGIIMVLPLIGVTTIGTATSGVLGWIASILVILLGLYYVVMDYSK